MKREWGYDWTAPPFDAPEGEELLRWPSWFYSADAFGTYLYLHFPRGRFRLYHRAAFIREWDAAIDRDRRHD
jgi:hypothetical protein